MPFLELQLDGFDTSRLPRVQLLFLLAIRDRDSVRGGMGETYHNVLLSTLRIGLNDDDVIMRDCPRRTRWATGTGRCRLKPYNHHFIVALRFSSRKYFNVIRGV
jgi:hypothetical protein